MRLQIRFAINGVLQHEGRNLLYKYNALCCWESIDGNCRQSWRFVTIIEYVIDNFTNKWKFEKEFLAQKY